LVLSGYLDVGMTSLVNSADTAVLGLWGEEAGVNGGRFKLIGKYDNGDYGLSFETRWDGLIGTNDLGKYTSSGEVASPIPVYFKHAYAYANFLDKMVYTQVGMVKEESTKTGGNKNFKFASETPGAVVVVKPVPEWAIQVFVAPAAGTSSVLSENVGNVADTQSALSTAYTLKGVARASAGVKLFKTNGDDYLPTAAYAGVNLYAVPNLTATVEGQIEALNTGKNDGVATVAETLSYNFKDLGLEALSVGVIAYQYLYGEDARTKDQSKVASAEEQEMALRLQPSVSYVVAPAVTVTLAAAYQKGAVIVTDGYTADLGKSLGVPFYTANKDPNKIATFEVKPSVKWALAKNQSLSFIYAFSTSIGEDDVTYLTANTDATSLQTFQTAYTYSF